MNRENRSSYYFSIVLKTLIIIIFSFFAVYQLYYQVVVKTPERFYKSADKNIDTGNFKEARKALSKLNSHQQILQQFIENDRYDTGYPKWISGNNYDACIYVFQNDFESAKKRIEYGAATRYVYRGKREDDLHEYIKENFEITLFLTCPSKIENKSEMLSIYRDLFTKNISLQKRDIFWNYGISLIVASRKQEDNDKKCRLIKEAFTYYDKALKSNQYYFPHEIADNLINKEIEDAKEDWIRNDCLKYLNIIDRHR